MTSTQLDDAAMESSLPAHEIETLLGAGAIRPRPVEFTHGSGARLIDSEGHSYIDATSSYGVASLGHAHPKLVAAISEQASRLMALTPSFSNGQRAAYMSALLQALGAPFSRVFLCNSGAEAMEATLKIARLKTGRTGVVACIRGFHGRTLGALSATAEKAYRVPFGPLVPGFTHVPYGRIDSLVDVVTDRTAAVVLEVIQGEGGVRPADALYLKAVRELCDSTGTLLTFDEVQTGFGRTGDLFAFQGVGVAPDLVALAKGIAGGFPMGAVAMSEALGAMPPGSHGSTFGGNPLACAAAHAVLKVIQEEGLVERARGLGECAIARLREGAGANVREVRGRGLMIGIELRGPVRPALDELFARRILVLPAGRNVLRLLPPLVIDEGDLNTVIENVLEVTA